MAWLPSIQYQFSGASLPVGVDFPGEILHASLVYLLTPCGFATPDSSSRVLFVDSSSCRRIGPTTISQSQRANLHDQKGPGSFKERLVVSRMTTLAAALPLGTLAGIVIAEVSLARAPRVSC